MVVCSVRFACNQCNGKRDGRTIVYRRTIFLHNIKILFPDFLSCVRPNLKIKKMIFSTWNFLEKPAENCSETFANINRDFYGTHRNWCEVMAMNYPRFIWRWGSHQHECWLILDQNVMNLRSRKHSQSRLVCELLEWYLLQSSNVLD